MLERNGTWTDTTEYKIDSWLDLHHTLLFDIETTGLSATNSMLYMIGFCYYDDSWNYRILFNDDGRSEYAIIKEFLSVLSNYTTVLHFNGDHFDLPFLIEKCRQYESLGLPLSNANVLYTRNSIDLYKIVRAYKSGLSLPNLKLQTLERAMGIHRVDATNGGELISVYRKYLQSPSASSEQLLFQHNYEDIMALVPMLRLLHFQGLSNHNWEILDCHFYENEVKIVLHLTHSLPMRYLLHTPCYSFNAFESEAVVTIPIITEELNYYLSNWKDYYYLPLEDKVVHKNIAVYVDSPCKEKAKKSNACIKKEGRFIAIPSSMNLSLHVYKHTHKDNQQYVSIDEINACKNDEQAVDFWSAYLSALI